MNIEVNFPQQKTIVLRPAQTASFSKLVIERIIDDPHERAIYVYLQEFGSVRVDALSDANYDNPQWTNETLVDAVRAQFS